MITLIRTPAAASARSRRCFFSMVNVRERSAPCSLAEVSSLLATPGPISRRTGIVLPDCTSTSFTPAGASPKAWPVRNQSRYPSFWKSANATYCLPASSAAAFAALQLGEQFAAFPLRQEEPHLGRPQRRDLPGCPRRGRVWPLPDADRLSSCRVGDGGRACVLSAASSSGLGQSRRVSARPEPGRRDSLVASARRPRRASRASCGPEHADAFTAGRGTPCCMPRALQREADQRVIVLRVESRRTCGIVAAGSAGEMVRPRNVLPNTSIMLSRRSLPSTRRSTGECFDSPRNQKPVSSTLSLVRSIGSRRALSRIRSPAMCSCTIRS